MEKMAERKRRDALRQTDSDLSKGISGKQAETGREGSFYKTDSEEGGQGILIPFHELR